MIRHAATLLILTAVAPCLIAEEERSMIDLLGGANWSERHGEAIVGWTSLDVDGYNRDQSAWYLSAAASAISGYRVKERPFGTILGLGASVKTWWGNDDVDVRSIAPFAYGIAGVFCDVNDRTRAEITGRAGPGLGWTKVGDESDIGFAWTWAAEGAITVTKGDSVGLGIGVGYEFVQVDEFTQEGPYVMLRVGF
jgi:hypothetical protein